MKAPPVTQTLKDFIIYSRYRKMLPTGISHTYSTIHELHKVTGLPKIIIKGIIKERKLPIPNTESHQRRICHTYNQ